MKIAICDNKSTDIERILGYLKDIDISIIALEISIFTYGEAVVEAYKNGARYDVLFLNVETGDFSGVGVAGRIRTIDADVLIFLTAVHEQYVQEAFRINAFQFIKKPIEQKIFKEEMQRAVNLIRKNRYLYSIINRDNIETVELDDVLYISILGRDIFIHTIYRVYEKKGKLKDEIEKLEVYDFVQYYKGGIVNLRNIKRITGDEIHLKTGEKIQMSRNFKPEVKKRFEFYIKKTFCMNNVERRIDRSHIYR